MGCASQPAQVCRLAGCVLAAGRGTRMGGVDKGLVLLEGEPMVQHVLRRLSPQLERIVINAARNLDAYRSFGYPVITDHWPGSLGPLAGMHAGLMAWQGQVDAVVFVPCDGPRLPADLVARLSAGLIGHRAALAVVGADHHATFAAVRCTEADTIAAYLRRGQRSVASFFAGIGAARVAFDDQPEALANINTTEQLAHLNGDALRS